MVLPQHPSRLSLLLTSRFDTVLFLEVLEHITDDRAALGEIHRVLRSDGRLILSVPVPPGEVDEDLAWGHKREGYQLQEIVSALANSSFEVQRFAFAEFEFSRRAARDEFDGGDEQPICPLRFFSRGLRI